jgi:hypothetical protein
MTPIEKAKELVDNFTFMCKECNYDWNAKQCALITVNEIINSKTLDIDFYIKTKKEIQKL